jgi:hypothetical protein
LDSTQLKYSKLQFKPAEPKQDMKDQNTKQTLSQNKEEFIQIKKMFCMSKTLENLKY